MSHNHTPDEQKKLDEMEAGLEQAREASKERSARVDDLTKRFRILRRKNHFHLMLEDLFND